MGDEIRSDAKLKNLTAEQLEELWEMRYPVDEDAEKLPYVRIASEELPRMVGYTVSLSTLSEFYAWLKQRKRMEAAEESAEQAKRDLLSMKPDASVEELERLGQLVFTSETIQGGNVKGFLGLMKESTARRKLELEKESAETRAEQTERRLKLAEEKLAQDERRIVLLEEKVKKADEAKADLEERKANGGLSAETMELIERTLGML